MDPESTNENTHTHFPILRSVALLVVSLLSIVQVVLFKRFVFVICIVLYQDLLIHLIQHLNILTNTLLNLFVSSW